MLSLLRLDPSAVRHDLGYLILRILWVTYQRGSDGGGRQRVGDNDEEDWISQQKGDLKGDPLSTVRRQIEADNVHHH